MPDSPEIQTIRKQYAETRLTESIVAPDPIDQFNKWLDDAQRAELPEPLAMSLSTATPDGRPSARMVLLRGFDETGFRFYTNYNSRKARELDANPYAALVFYWTELDRQIRIEGHVDRTSPEDSDAYFKTRPRGSRISAIASNQSAVLPSRDELEARMDELEKQYPGEDVPRPAHWGGYRVIPEIIEFWQGGAHRLHDRIQYTRQPDGEWQICRLAP